MNAESVAPDKAGECVQPAFSWPLRIYYEDTDLSGVVYHANYLRYFERARTEWVRAIGLGQERLMQSEGLAFTVADLQIRYLRPARLDDELEVTVAVLMKRRASLLFEQHLRRAHAPKEILATAQVRVACVDVRSFRPRPLPALLMKGERS